MRTHIIRLKRFLMARSRALQHDLLIRRLFPGRAIASIIVQNRKTLREIPCWIEDSIYNNGVFHYGLPPELRSEIDKDIGNEITYSDAIVYLTRIIKNRIRYLELGVSVGKNFVQILNAVKNGELVGFDIEEINPTIEHRLSLHHSDSWPSKAGSLKKGSSSLKRYRYEGMNNDVFYVSADIWDERAWSFLSGHRFNIIFSDALHSPDALVHEYEMLHRYDLLENEFIIVWDDLHGEMAKAFYHITDRIISDYSCQRHSRFILQLRGWLGVNEPKHPVGLLKCLR